MKVRLGVTGSQKVKFETETDMITEIVIATNPSVEGEATALYIINY